MVETTRGAIGSANKTLVGGVMVPSRESDKTAIAESGGVDAVEYPAKLGIHFILAPSMRYSRHKFEIVDHSVNDVTAIVTPAAIVPAGFEDCEAA